MKRTFLLLLLAALIPTVAFAQRGMRRAPYLHTGSFMIGMQHLDLTDFNNALTARYPQVKDNLLAIGGQGMTLRRRFLVGAEGMFATSGRQVTSVAAATTQYHTRLMSGYGSLNFGYAAVHDRGWLVYPQLGLGAGGITYTITPINGTTFQDVLNNPGQSSEISTGAVIVAVRGGVQYNIRIHSRRERMPGGLSLGVRAGYSFAPWHSEWHMMEQTNVTNGPKTTPAGPQVVFTIGGWRQGRALR